MTTKEFIPVIIGSNKGSYSIARAFHEAYGKKSEVIIREDLGATAHSSIMNKHQYSELLDDFPKVAKSFKRRLDDMYPQTQKIILGSDDWFVEQVIKERAIFEGDWLVPYVDQETLNRAVNKSSFYEVCEKHQIPHPRTYDSDGDLSLLPADQAYVVKAANTPVYQNLEFEGKEKVFICENRAEAEAAINLIRQAGYQDEIVLQDFISSQPPEQATITLYRSPHDQEIKLFSFGRIMVEDPTPLALGNYLTILTGEAPQKVLADASTLMEALNWTGFANFDLIYDSRQQVFNFLELNPRLGISNYYVTAGGANVSRFYVEDYLFEQPMPFQQTEKAALFNSIPKVLTKAVVGKTPYWENIQDCYRNHEVYNALLYDQDKHWKRQLYVTLNKYNYIKKFKQVGRI